MAPTMQVPESERVALEARWQAERVFAEAHGLSREDRERFAGRSDAALAKDLATIEDRLRVLEASETALDVARQRDTVARAVEVAARAFEAAARATVPYGVTALAEAMPRLHGLYVAAADQAFIAAINQARGEIPTGADGGLDLAAINTERHELQARARLIRCEQDARRDERDGQAAA